MATLYHSSRSNFSLYSYLNNSNHKTTTSILTKSFNSILSSNPKWLFSKMVQLLSCRHSSNTSNSRSMLLSKSWSNSLFRCSSRILSRSFCHRVCRSRMLKKWWFNNSSNSSSSRFLNSNNIWFSSRKHLIFLFKCKDRDRTESIYKSTQIIDL